MTHPKFRRYPVEVGSFQLTGRGRNTQIKLYPGRGPEQLRADDDADTSPAHRRAQQLQALLDNGTVSNRAELARLLGISRPRVSQILGPAKGGRDHGKA